jgi:hypothetical protein
VTVLLVTGWLGTTGEAIGLTLITALLGTVSAWWLYRATLQLRVGEYALTLKGGVGDQVRLEDRSGTSRDLLEVEEALECMRDVSERDGVRDVTVFYPHGLRQRRSEIRSTWRELLRLRGSTDDVEMRFVPAWSRVIRGRALPGAIVGAVFFILPLSYILGSLQLVEVVKTSAEVDRVLRDANEAEAASRRLTPPERAALADASTRVIRILSSNPASRRTRLDLLGFLESPQATARNAGIAQVQGLAKQSGSAGLRWHAAYVAPLADALDDHRMGISENARQTLASLVTRTDHLEELVLHCLAERLPTWTDERTAAHAARLLPRLLRNTDGLAQGWQLWKSTDNAAVRVMIGDPIVRVVLRRWDERLDPESTELEVSFDEAVTLVDEWLTVLPSEVAAEWFHDHLVRRNLRMAMTLADRPGDETVRVTQQGVVQLEIERRIEENPQRPPLPPYWLPDDAHPDGATGRSDQQGRCGGGPTDNRVTSWASLERRARSTRRTMRMPIGRRSRRDTTRSSC